MDPTRTGNPDGVQTESMSAAPARIRPLDGLRGVAALVVVLFHLRNHLSALPLPGSLLRLLGGGWLMVDLFFVLSGFVLAPRMSSVRDLSLWRGFAMWRIRRFAPIHLAAWGGCLLYFVALFAREQITGLMGEKPALSGQTGLRAWLSSGILVQGYFGPDQSGYGPGWSLSIELWSNFLIAALCVWWGFKRAAVITTGLGIALMPFYFSASTMSVGGGASARGLLGLGAGMLAHQLAAHVDRRWKAEALAWTGLASLLILMTMSSWRPGAAVCALPAAALVLGLARGGAAPLLRLLAGRRAQWLGSRSFALYALSSPAGYLVGGALLIADWQPSSSTEHVLIVGAYVIASLIAAEIGHRYVERLFRARRLQLPVAAPAVLPSGVS
jgi:peptidoglycan/LPS O-acetylase OafA/YrhL